MYAYNNLQVMFINFVWMHIRTDSYLNKVKVFKARKKQNIYFKITEKNLN